MWSQYRFLIFFSVVVVFSSLTCAIGFLGGYRQVRQDDKSELFSLRFQLIELKDTTKSLEGKNKNLQSCLLADQEKKQLTDAEITEKNNKLNELASQLKAVQSNFDKEQNTRVDIENKFVTVKADLAKVSGELRLLQILQGEQTEKNKDNRRSKSEIASLRLKEFTLQLDSTGRRQYNKAYEMLFEINSDVNSGAKVPVLPSEITSTGSRSETVKMIIAILEIGGDYYPIGSKFTLSESWTKALLSTDLGQKR